MRVERRFAADVASPGAARRFVRQTLADLPPEELDAVELMVSELATNAVRHAASDFVLTIEATRRGTRIEVSDAGTGSPVLRAPGHEDESGRGLRVVDGLARSWGVGAGHASGKSVWFTAAGLRHCAQAPC